MGIFERCNGAQSALEQRRIIASNALYLRVAPGNVVAALRFRHGEKFKRDGGGGDAHLVTRSRDKNVKNWAVGGEADVDYEPVADGHKEFRRGGG